MSQRRIFAVGDGEVILSVLSITNAGAAGEAVVKVRAEEKKEDVAMLLTFQVMLEATPLRPLGMPREIMKNRKTRAAAAILSAVTVDGPGCFSFNGLDFLRWDSDGACFYVPSRNHCEATQLQ